MSKSEPCLPANWVRVTLSDVYTLIGGGTPSTTNEGYWNGDTPWITSADIEGVKRITVRRHVSDIALEDTAANKVPPGSLLVATRVGLGKVAIVDHPISFSQDIQALIQDPDLLDPFYTLHFLSFALPRLKFEGRGTTISGITKRQLGNVRLPLPPLREQRRIISRLDELFSELDAGVDSLKTARGQLKLYRQALLKYAFEGMLTADWRRDKADEFETADELLARIHDQRRQNWESDQLARFATEGKVPPRDWKSRYQEPAVPNTAEVPALPSGWKWASLDALTNGIRGGTTEKPTDSKTEWPVLRSSSVRAGSLDTDDVSYLTGEQSTAAAFFVCDGDLLITRLSGSIDYVGNCAIAKNLGDQCIQFPDRLFRARPVFPTLAKLIEVAFASGYSRQRIRKEAMSSAGHQRLAIRNLVGHPVPLPPMAEQLVILDEVDRRLSVADALAVEIDTQLTASEALRQSILERAFAGQLVPQDTSDEPASILLERIRAAKATVGDTKPTGGQRGRKSSYRPAGVLDRTRTKGDQMPLGEGVLFE